MVQSLEPSRDFHREAHRKSMKSDQEVPGAEGRAVQGMGKAERRL